MSLNLGKPIKADKTPAAPEASTPNMAATSAGNESQTAAETEPEEEVVVYTCHPVERFTIGTSWVFERGVLRISPDEAVKLDRYLEKADSRTKNLVRKIDAGLANRFVINHIARATKSIDTSTNIESQQTTQLGTQEIGPKA